MEVTVECQKRPEGSKPNALRRDGLTPAVLYGHKGNESIPLTINTKTAEMLLKKASVNNTLIQLSVPEIPWTGQTLIKEVQSHPWKRSLYHLSFFAVEAHGDLDVEVPLHFLGEPIGVKRDGGLLDPVITEIQVRCAPDKIPESIEIDVSEMVVGDNLHISDLVLPAGVTALADPTQMVVSILVSRTAAQDAADQAAEG